MERVRVYYSGRVQGVGFRYTAERLARGREVAGSVRNLADGRVELVAEGEPAVVRGFLEGIAAALGPKIREADSRPESPTDPPLSGFVILP